MSFVSNDSMMLCRNVTMAGCSTILCCIALFSIWVVLHVFFPLGVLYIDSGSISAPNHLDHCSQTLQSLRPSFTVAIGQDLLWI